MPLKLLDATPRSYPGTTQPRGVETPRWGLDKIRRGDLETPETPDGKHHSQKLKLKHIKQPRVIGEEGWKDGDVEG